MPRPSDEDFCLIHGRDLMKADLGNPVAYCAGCERALAKLRPRYRDEVERVNRATDREIDAAISSGERTK